MAYDSQAQEFAYSFYAKGWSKPRALAEIRKVYPGLSASTWDEWVEKLDWRERRGLADAKLREFEDLVRDTARVLLLELDEVAVLPAGHPLRAKKRLAASDFAGQAFVSFHPRDRYRQWVDKVFAEAGVDRQLAVETDSAVAVCAMVRHGLGLAIVNPLTALALSGAADV